MFRFDMYDGIFVGCILSVTLLTAICLICFIIFDFFCLVNHLIICIILHDTVMVSLKVFYHIMCAYKYFTTFWTLYLFIIFIGFQCSILLSAFD